MEFSRYLRVVQRRKAIIVITILVTVCVVIVYMLISSPIYTAVTKLRVQPLGVNGPDYGTLMYYDKLATTYSELMKSQPVVAEAEKRLGLGIDELPKFRLEMIPQTEIMQISVDALDPTLAQNASNTLGKLLVEQNQAIYLSDTDSVQAVLRKRLDELEADIEHLDTERTQLLNQVPRDQERISTIERTIDSRQQTYNLALSSYNQALVSRTTMANAITIMEPAQLPLLPSSPNPVRDTLLAGIVGLLGGVMLAFAIESAHPRLASDKHIQTITKVPIVGKIPRIKSAKRNNAYETDPAFVEAFHRLRINLFRRMPANSIRVLLVTSAMPKEGKSTVAANLAIDISRSGQQVIIVDCDLRLPTTHQIFGLGNQAGLTDVLVKNTSLESAIVHTDIPELKVLTAGSPINNPSDVLDSAVIAALIHQLSMAYDLVVLDSSPLIPVIDSAALSRHTDGVILVVDPSQADQKSVTLASDQLETVGARCLGVVVNRVKKDNSLLQYQAYSRRKRDASRASRVRGD